ncbi:hypothetical protein NC652_029635 [Populus alba x Populus x berolinensis]|nr:hypothetical protein NC652_029635 [Populus alba x Populus x berolinensis]
MIVRSHIESERLEPGPYKCMLTLTSKTHFGVMRGGQKQSREGNLGRSPKFGWTGRPKANNILLVKLISGAKEKVEIEEQLSQCLLLDVKGKSRGKRLCGGCWKEVQWLVTRGLAAVGC